MPERAKVAVFVSGKGTNMAALLYASRLAGSAYEIVLVAANDPHAEALIFAKAEGIETFPELAAAQSAKVNFAQGYLLARPGMPPPKGEWPGSF